MSFTYKIFGVLSAATLLLAASAPAFAQEVYVGSADQWPDLYTHRDQWTYVQQNADGFYINFMMLNKRYPGSQGLLDATCKLFSRHKSSHMWRVGTLISFLQSSPVKISMVFHLGTLMPSAP